ncbi:MAG: YceI family protein [Proteobacteria bacterium]|nr:YceI family protein [Pseudomonadota bacterium]
MRISPNIGHLISIFLLVVAVPCPAADRFRIDPDHSFAMFEYDHWGLSYQRGRFDRTSGFIELDMEAKSGSIDIEIEAGSISTGVGIFDKLLRSGDFFDTDNHPKTIFSSKRLVFDAEKLARVEGELTIKGITRATTLEITNFNCRFMIVYGKYACGANGLAKISRSEFNMGRYAPFVSDAVTLLITVEAIKE